MTVVVVLEHTVYEAVCQKCPWTRDGFTEQEWAKHVGEQHEKTEHPTQETGR